MIMKNSTINAVYMLLCAHSDYCDKKQSVECRILLRLCKNALRLLLLCAPIATVSQLLHDNFPPSYSFKEPRMKGEPQLMPPPVFKRVVLKEFRVEECRENFWTFVQQVLKSVCHDGENHVSSGWDSGHSDAIDYSVVCRKTAVKPQFSKCADYVSKEYFQKSTNIGISLIAWSEKDPERDLICKKKPKTKQCC